jgi:hypothetical protein
MTPSEDIPVDTSIDPDIVPPEPCGRKRGKAAPEPDPEPIEDRRIVGELIEEEEEEPSDITVLTAQERQDLALLMTVGRRTKTINVRGHDVVIQTLQTGDEMRIGLYTKPYLDTQGFSRAYQVGVCAAGIIEIKNQELWDALKKKPLAEVTSPDDIFAKSAEALTSFYPIVVAEIYQAIMDLEREFADLAIKLGK